jgi:hypothetical protein
MSIVPLISIGRAALGKVRAHFTAGKKAHSLALIALASAHTLAACDGPLAEPAEDPTSYDESAGAQVAGGNIPADQMLPARVRRLSNREFDLSVKQLLGIDSVFGASFTPDTRQDGFTRNDAQRVDPVFIQQLSEAAQKLAEQARSRVQNLAPCQQQTGSEQCARQFIENFAKKAYRRPATQREVDALLKVYKAGAEGATYADGIVGTIQAFLQSPGFIYITEIGSAKTTPSVSLTPYEVASSLSYLLTGMPPDDQLMQAAQSNQLTSADQRLQHARRLLQTQQAGAQVTRMVQEWLGIDRIGETAKDSNVYPQFAGLRDAMKREANDFVQEVMWKGGGVKELLSADWTIAEDGLARMYLNNQAPQRNNNRVSLASTRRRGVLNQGAFLAVNAHATESAPILRGVAVLRRILCVDIPSPTTLNINVVPPIPDPQKTTRERFAIHSKDAACAGCHKSIDPLGFSFEALDGMGKSRTTENNKPVDSAVTVTGLGLDGPYPDSAALALKIAQLPTVQQCFARHLFRFAAARSDNLSAAAEDAFMTTANALPAGVQGKFADVLLSFISSPAFVQRGVTP